MVVNTYVQATIFIPDKHNWACPRAVEGLDDSLFLHLMKLLGHLLMHCKRETSDRLRLQWCITNVNVNFDEHIMKLLQE